MIENKIEFDNGLILNVRSNKALDNDTIVEIKQLNLNIYHNDFDSTLWSFDTKLNNGNWLENIYFNNELTKGKALINN